MSFDFRWKLTEDEKTNLSSKITSLYPLHTSPEENKFILKSQAFSDSGSSTEWYLIITSGKDYCIQVKLCLANSKNLGHLHVAYKLVFRTRKERACYETKCVFKSEENCQHSCSEKFLNAFYLLRLLQESLDIIFVCNMQIQAVQVLNKTSSSIQSDYEKLLKDTNYSDFMVITSTKKFNVHKNILSARSEVFSAMFAHNMKEKQEGFAEIKEFDDEVIQEFLRYIYCGRVENLSKLAKNLLGVAEKYLVFDLKVLCLEEFCKNINIENALELLVLVDNHNIEHLRSTVMDFIVKNIKNHLIKSNLNVIQNVNLLHEILSLTINRYV